MNSSSREKLLKSLAVIERMLSSNDSEASLNAAVREISPGWATPIHCLQFLSGSTALKEAQKLPMEQQLHVMQILFLAGKATAEMQLGAGMNAQRLRALFEER